MARLVALTGATGFVGSHAARVFAESGWNVRVLARRLPSNALLASVDPELIVGDLDDAPALQALVRGADVVVHAAGAVRALDAVGFYRANAQGAASIVAAVQCDAPQTRLILVSSLSAREPTLSDYVGSKRAGEVEVERAGTALDWSIIRPPAVYGPGDRETLAYFRAVSRGLAPRPAIAAARLSLIHVEDLAEALALAVERAPAGAVYEIDDGREGGYGYRDMQQSAAAALGRKALSVAVPRPLMAGLARLNQLGHRLGGPVQILTPGKVGEIFHPDWTVHDRRLAGAIGFTARYDLASGFRDTVLWYRRREWL